MATDNNNEQAEGGASKKRFLPVALAAAAALLAGGLSGAFVAGPLLAKRAGATPAAVAEHADGEDEAGHGEGGGKDATAARPLHSVENLVLNPAGTNGTRFLMVTVALELADEAAAEQAKQRDPEIRDVLLRVLGTQTVDRLTDVATREALKQELKDSTALVFAKKGAVRRLYLPQFVVQ